MTDSKTGLEKARDAYNSGNYSEAFQLFHELAEQGCDDAQFQLVHMYYEGLGVEKDNVQAYKWLGILYKRGLKDKDIVESYFLKLLKSSMTDEQFEEAERLALEWLQDYKKRRK